MDIVDVIAPIFTHIVNLIFKHSIFLSKLKKSKIVPVHKKADKSLLNKGPSLIFLFSSKVVIFLLKYLLVFIPSDCFVCTVLASLF